jgi:hypothetical protein
MDAFSWLMISFGVSAGASQPCQPTDSYPGNPLSEMVDTSGSAASRRGPVTPVARSLPASMPHVRAGQMRALAVSGLKRSAALADTPTMAEAGVPGFDLTSWNGVLAPAGTPVDIIARLNREIEAAGIRDE